MALRAVNEAAAEPGPILLTTQAPTTQRPLTLDQAVKEVIGEFLRAGPKQFIFNFSKTKEIGEGRRYESWEVSNLYAKEEYAKGLKCINCKAETVVFFIKQTRRADENATTYFICRSCGETWKR